MNLQQLVEMISNTLPLSYQTIFIEMYNPHIFSVLKNLCAYSDLK